MRLQRFGPIWRIKLGLTGRPGQLVAGGPETGDASSDQHRAALPETLPYSVKSRSILGQVARYMISAPERAGQSSSSRR